MKLESVIELGNTVFCDWCGKDYTNSDEEGGILFVSKACCPQCVSKVRASAKKYHEERFIKEECPEGMKFREWIMKLRGGDNTVKTYSQNY